MCAWTYYLSTKTRKQYNTVAGYSLWLPNQWRCQKPGAADRPPKHTQLLSVAPFPLHVWKTFFQTWLLPPSWEISPPHKQSWFSPFSLVGNHHPPAQERGRSTCWEHSSNCIYCCCFRCLFSLYRLNSARPHPVPICPHPWVLSTLNSCGVVGR